LDEQSANHKAIFELLDQPGVVDILIALRERGGTAAMDQIGVVGRLWHIRRLSAVGFVSVHSSLDDWVDPAMPVSLTESGHGLAHALGHVEECVEGNLVGSLNRPQWVFQLRAWMARMGRR
jgi:hypothetical protein